MLLYLQKCLEYAAGVTEEDRIKNCILPSVAQYVEKLLTDVIVEGIHFVLWLVQKSNLNLSTNQMRNEKKKFATWSFTLFRASGSFTRGSP